MLGSARRSSHGGMAGPGYEGRSRRTSTSGFSLKHFQSSATNRSSSATHEGGNGSGRRALRLSTMSAMPSDASWLHEASEDKEDHVQVYGLSSRLFKVVVLWSLLALAIQTGLEVDLETGSVGIIIQYSITVIWILEACVKAYCAGVKEYLKTFTTPLELLSLCLAVLEAWIVPHALAQWPEVQRALVIGLYYSRLLRLLRVIFLLQELRLLISGLIIAIKQLVWVIILITLVIYGLAVIVSRMVGQDCSGAYAFWDECEDMFGSLPKSMISLLEMMTLDMQAVRPLLQGNPLSVLLLSFFFMVTSFGLLNIITGVVVDTVLAASADGQEAIAEQKAIQKQDDLENLRGILTEILQDDDLKRDDQISLHEFLDGCRRPDVQVLLRDAGIPVVNKTLARSLFLVLDSDGVGEISIDDFMERTSNLLNEGRHSPQDHTLLLMDIRLLHRHIVRLERSQALLHRKIDQVLRPADLPEQQSNAVRTSLSPFLISGQDRRCSSAPPSTRLNAELTERSMGI